MTKEHYISAYLCLFSLIMLFGRYGVCLDRLIESLRDVGTSFAYYFLYLFDRQDRITPTVIRMPAFSVEDYLPFDFVEIERKLDILFENIIDVERFFGYCSFLVRGLNLVLVVLTLILPCVALLFYLRFCNYTKQHVERKEKKRLHQRLPRWIGIGWHQGTKVVSDYRRFLKKNEKYAYVLLVIWLVNTNLMTILCEAVAYYFYILASFDVASIFGQLVKLVFDLILALWALPIWLWLVVGYGLFDKIRINVALDSLRHMEAKNRGFYNSLSMVVMITGSMGTGKTRMAVDMALSFENEFRDRALDLMLKNMLRFPHFDFLRFQKSLMEEVKEGRVNNWAGCRRWVRECRTRYEEEPCSDKLFGYDEKRYSMTYNDGLKILNIWDMLENYAQEYFLYVSVSSLIISNFSIRCDVDQTNPEYFPKWNGDFFKRDPVDMPETSRYAHIIDFDLFRLGCQMNQANKISGAFEFGVIVLTEIGKERGNALENQEYKKNSTKANPKNDMFNAWMKLLRHAGTVEGVCFVRLICDEQRAGSWGADARDTATVLNIKEVLEQETVLGGNWFAPMITCTLLPWYLKYYKKVLTYGNARVPSVERLHAVVSGISAYCDRRLNQYGYKVATVAKQDGTLEDEPVDHEVYVSFKKDYAKRYSTDCYKEYFAERALSAEYDFINSDTYKDDCALLEELERQNSYLVAGLLDLLKSDTANK